MPLPGSGPISASQVGVYVFDRTSTQIFSLSASLAGTSANKGYTTLLGPLWIGNGTGDISNAQYNQGANNFDMAAWYNYTKGVEITVSQDAWETRAEACSDTNEQPRYTTEFTYWGAGANGITPNSSVVYDNTEGTTPLSGDGGFYRKVTPINQATGFWSGQFDTNGIFTNEDRC